MNFGVISLCWIFEKPHACVLWPSLSDKHKREFRIFFVTWMKRNQFVDVCSLFSLYFQQSSVLAFCQRNQFQRKEPDNSSRGCCSRVKTVDCHYLSWPQLINGSKKLVSSLSVIYWKYLLLQTQTVSDLQQGFRGTGTAPWILYL